MEKLNRTPVIIASIIFAIGLWLTVNLGFNYATTKDIPIVIQNLADDIALQNTPPEYVRARVRGEGWKLLGMKIGGDTKYIIDLEHKRSSVTLQTAEDLSERVRLPSGIDITEIAPAQLTLELEPITESRIPIDPVLDITYRNGFDRVGPAYVYPESVTIRGAASVVGAINSWKTEPITMREVRKPVQKTVDLSDSLSRIISLDVGTCEVQFDVQWIAEKTISGLPVDVGGIPANREVILIPPRMDIIIRGGINRLAPIEKDSFTVRIYYRDILADTSGAVIPHIEGPKDIRIVQRTPERLHYVIRRTQ